VWSQQHAAAHGALFYTKKEKKKEKKEKKCQKG
jgi:hypothetical protein